VQIGIAPPPPIPIDFEDNPDTLALKSAISILQLQRRTAERDIKILRRIKERATEEPLAFTDALAKGQIKTVAADQISESEGEDEDVEMFVDGGGQNINGSKDDGDLKKQREWERVPGQQNVIRCPPVNWNQYAVVGDSLEKLHQDQLSRMSEGMPQRFVEGQYRFGGEGQRRPSHLGNVISAPYTPGKDVVEKMGTRKAGKR